MENVERINPLARGSAPLTTWLVLLAWFFVALALGTSGALSGRGGPPIAMGLAITIPLLAFAVDGRLGHPLFRGLVGLSPAALVAIQIPRVLGVVFLVAWWRGTLPAGFALPAGLGDVAIGLAAPFVAAAIAARRPGHRTLARVWNLLGLADLIVAVASGVLHASATFGGLATTVNSAALAVYPLSLIPTFLVPLAVMLHIASLRATRNEED